MQIKDIKKFLARFVMLLIVFVTFSCAKNTESVVETTTKDIYNFEQNVKRRGMVVAYFSINDDVKVVAEKFKEALNADILQIEAVEPYTEDDLNFYNENSRVKLEDEFNPLDKSIEIEEEEYETSEGIFIATKSKIEKNKITELPKIKSNSANSYPIIIVGFPVWYENAPKVIYTFMQGLKNKIVIPFCTGKDMGMIDQYLSSITDKSVTVMSGKSFDSSASVEEIREWVTMLSADFDS